MADIPIEKKKSGAWWIWLIVAAAIIALLIGLFSGNDDRVERSAPVAGTVAGAGMAGNMMTAEDSAATTGPITDLKTLLAGETAAVVGREVRLTNVEAGRVPADAGFWITGQNGRREYVVLNEARTPNTAIEGEVNVTDGARVDIVGTVRSADEGAPEGAAIPGPTAPLPEGIDHYIEAQAVTKTA